MSRYHRRVILSRIAQTRRRVLKMKSTTFARREMSWIARLLEETITGRYLQVVVASSSGSCENHDLRERRDLKSTARRLFPLPMFVFSNGSGEELLTETQCRRRTKSPRGHYTTRQRAVTGALTLKSIHPGKFPREPIRSRRKVTFS